ncbi:hypothetical protein ACFL7M_04055 [Thermodesulfobacteriota bacterium]
MLLAKGKITHDLINMLMSWRHSTFNVSCGKRKQENQDEWIPRILESDETSKEYRKNWARLIQKIYELDPLTCPKCQGRLRIIAFIEDPEIIKKILKHLGSWEIKERPPPRANVPPKYESYVDYYDSQLPASDKRLKRLKVTIRKVEKSKTRCIQSFQS